MLSFQSKEQKTVSNNSFQKKKNVCLSNAGKIVGRAGLAGKEMELYLDMMSLRCLLDI